jgi:hypothetical protein
MWDRARGGDALKTHLAHEGEMSQVAFKYEKCVQFEGSRIQKKRRFTEI